ncbi:uncharacterized protein LOC115920756 [Strongylocentrotus purpuratus]|uniref:Uncharacterized protein n=1 Tax=Strongylocentrotus purpuratus TaxID=7668 RepID=A0A7M7N9J9_STRPU|nr:uncharacterized protein LOC115920756 [Strongylocentrotus purpuratus]
MSTNGSPPGNDDGKHRNPRVMMWCVSRSVSTAMTKCMSFVEGAEVWLEPYYTSKAADDTHHMHHPDSSFPLELEGNEDSFRETAINLALGGDDFDRDHLDLLSPVSLKRIFDNLDPAKKFVFIKDLALGMPPSRFPYLPDRSSGIKHFFLIRHPVKAYKSLRKCLLNFILPSDPASEDVGIKMPDEKTFHIIKDIPSPREGTLYNYQAIHELWSHIRKTVDKDPVIVDIDEVLENPSAMMPRLCNALAIPYSKSLLSWDASSDVVLKWKSSCSNVRDSPRYAMWFTNAFKSSCFKASSTTASLDDATDDIKEVVEKEMPFYEEMYNLRLTI